MEILISDFIIINKPIEEVFQYIANLENDKMWRKEINHTQMNGVLGLNVQAIEDSFLSKRVPNHRLVLQCTQFDKNNKIVYETISGSAYYLKSTREAEVVSKHKTKFLYTLVFDSAVVKHGLGFSLPNFITKFVAKKDMKKYLRQLIVVMEG